MTPDTPEAELRDISTLNPRIAFALSEWRTVSNLMWQDFHGQEEGEDEAFDELCIKARAIEDRLFEAIIRHTAKATLEARIDEFNKLLVGLSKDGISLKTKGYQYHRSIDLQAELASQIGKEEKEEK